MYNKKLAFLCSLLLLAAFGYQSFGQPYSVIVSGLMVFFVIILLFTRRKVNKKEPEESLLAQPQTTKIKPLDYQAQKHVSTEIAEAPMAALGSQHSLNEWNAIEKEIDIILDDCIKIIKSHVDAHTVAIFFPTSDGGYKLRRHFSQSNCINENAVIYPGVGIIGGFLKDGIQQVNLHEIKNDSTTLYYYHNDAGVRSLMACPIVANEVERGVIIVDSTSVDFFTNESLAFLDTSASLLGRAVFNTYLYTEHKLEHIRLAAMSNIEKVFFRDLSIDTILDKMVEVIPFAIACDRLTISIKSENGDSAEILRSWGTNCEAFSKLKFPLNNKHLVPLLYTKNISLYRNFSKDRYEMRYLDNEPEDMAFNSFLAVPIGVDNCRGVLFMESFKKNAFNDSCKDLINRIATSAGLAIAKILIYEKAKVLATHDGLTGLNNHRE
ncbi:MAG: GAF domain-containing protein, partial [Fibrobacter sp.]|nr:GAF domain-containing protein [Fibrobacter sp.]